MKGFYILAVCTLIAGCTTTGTTNENNTYTVTSHGSKDTSFNDAFNHAKEKCGNRTVKILDKEILEPKTAESFGFGSIEPSLSALDLFMQANSQHKTTLIYECINY